MIVTFGVIGIVLVLAGCVVFAYQLATIEDAREKGKALRIFNPDFYTLTKRFRFLAPILIPNITKLRNVYLKEVSSTGWQDGYSNLKNITDTYDAIIIGDTEATDKYNAGYKLGKNARDKVKTHYATSSSNH